MDDLTRSLKEYSLRRFGENHVGLPNFEVALKECEGHYSVIITESGTDHAYSPPQRVVDDIMSQARMLRPGMIFHLNPDVTPVEFTSPPLALEIG